MEKLKGKLKHNHTLTDLIKTCVFAIVLMAPFFAVLTTCLYAICNKNAYQSYTDTATLENAFYHGVNQLSSSALFGWTTNTALYTSICTMTQGLDIDPTNNTLALLLTYWTLIIIVYVIMDIVITLFTKITHFLAD